jgi:hypothetical protein
MARLWKRTDENTAVVFSLKVLCCEKRLGRDDTMEQQRLTKRQNAIQALKFLLFSISAGAVETVSFTILKELAHLPYWPSYLVALVLSVLYNFTLNRAFTFQSAANVPVAMLKVFCYYLVFTRFPLVGRRADRRGLERVPRAVFDHGGKLVTEYLFCRFVVYRNNINNNARGRRENERYAHREPQE